MMPDDLRVTETGIAPPPPSLPCAPRILTGRAVLFMLLGFFLVTSSVNAVMITLAVRTMPGVSVKNAYEASQAFNAEATRIAAQDALGLQVEVARAGLRSGGEFVLMVRDKQGNPVSGLEAVVRLGRPVDQRFDVVLPLTPDMVGRYRAALPPLALGQWDITIELMRKDALLYRAHERIVVSQ